LAELGRVATCEHFPFKGIVRICPWFEGNAPKRASNILFLKEINADSQERHAESAFFIEDTGKRDFDN